MNKANVKMDECENVLICEYFKTNGIMNVLTSSGIYTGEKIEQ